MRGPRGGILLDLFLILLLLAGGAAAWVTRDRWRGLWDRWGNGGAPAQAPADVPWDPRGARVQAEVRDLLSGDGLDERTLLATLNEERRDSRARWVESTLELRPRGPFHTGRFLSRLAAPLHRAGLAVLKDARDGDRWILELGDGARVFQRLIVHPALTTKKKDN